MIMNINYHTVTWDTETILMKDTGTLSSAESLIEIFFIQAQMNDKRSEINILQVIKF
jgi:hypothetical protein